MSTGFGGASTKGMKGFEREVETRMAADNFKEGRGDHSKTSNNYQDKHTDTSSADSTSSLAVGNPKVQEEMDTIDEIENLFQVPIKKRSDQFPGSKLEAASDNAGLDIHQVDPARMKKMGRMSTGDKRMKALSEEVERKSKPGDGPDAFHKEVEKRLSTKKQEIKEGLMAYVESHGIKFGLTILKNGTKVYSDDGFLTEDEAFLWAKHIAKEKNL